MKKYLQSIYILAISILFASCNSEGNQISEVKLIPVKNGKEFQYINQEGKIIINPQFNQATVFRNDLALVQSSGSQSKWGFISEEGKYVIMATYKQATFFSEDLAWVVSENAAPAAINAKGEIKITLKDAQEVRIFKEGLAAFCVRDSSGNKWGFIDKEGKIKINPQFYYVGNFSEGKCWVQTKEDNSGGGKYGYIDNEGKLIINYQFNSAENFINGTAVVYLNDKAGVIDANGKYIINPQYKFMRSDGDDFIIEQDNKFGVCNKDGKLTVNPQFMYLQNFLGNEIAPAIITDNSNGYIDKDGKIVINPQFINASPFNGNLAAVQNDNKWGFIDKEGKYIINPQFDDISKDYWAFINNLPSEYESVKTDYFDDKIIVDLVQKIITAPNVDGIDFTTTTSRILSKYNKRAEDFIYSETDVSEQIINNDVRLIFYIKMYPYQTLQNYGGPNYQGPQFGAAYLPNTTPTGFTYRIILSGAYLGKEDKVFNSIKASIKPEEAVIYDENQIMLTNDFDFTIIKSNGIEIKIDFPTSYD